MGENKVKTRTHATNSTQLNGQTAECVWYPGGGKVKRPEVCITDPSKIEILGMESVAMMCFCFLCDARLGETPTSARARCGEHSCSCPFNPTAYRLYGRTARYGCTRRVPPQLTHAANVNLLRLGRVG